MTNSAQERIAAMESSLKANAIENGSQWAHYSINVMATSRGWVVYLDSNRIADGIGGLDKALEAAEAHVATVVSADRNLARTLGIAS